MLDLPSGQRNGQTHDNIFKIVSNGKLVEIKVKLFRGTNKRFKSLVILSDITKINEFNKNKYREKFKNMLLSSVAHNLKTPLNGI